MAHETGELSEPRELSPEELELIEWLLRHGVADFGQNRTLEVFEPSKVSRV